MKPPRIVTHFFLRFVPAFSELRRLPVVGSIIRWAANVLLRDTRSWFQIQDGPAKGLWMHLNPRIGHDYFLGLVEPAVQLAGHQHIRPGMTFYDLGANIGFFSLLAARLVGPSGRVFSFEADPEIASRLRENIERNQFSWLTVEPLAVWSSSGVVPFAFHLAEDSFDRGLSRVTTQPTSEKTIQVQAISLDDFTAAAPAPDFIKCDVEGAEVEVFRGAARLFAAKHPIILCELHIEECRAALLQEFTSLGYLIPAPSPNHILALPQ